MITYKLYFGVQMEKFLYRDGLKITFKYIPADITLNNHYFIFKRRELSLCIV